jgi:hypothetical protein
MFRRRPPSGGDAQPSARPVQLAVDPRSNLELRLKALGYLLDAHSFTAGDLCILEQDDGFLVTGFRIPDHGSGFGLVEHTQRIGADEIAATIALLKG